VKQQASTGVAYEGQPNQSKACRSTAGRTASSNWQFSAENWFELVDQFRELSSTNSAHFLDALFASSVSFDSKMSDPRHVCSLSKEDEYRSGNTPEEKDDLGGTSRRCVLRIDARNHHRREHRSEDTTAGSINDRTSAASASSPLGVRKSADAAVPPF
jgi:hypothetical protein